MPHRKLLDRAKVDLMSPPTVRGVTVRDNPIFYSSILFSLKIVWVGEDHPIKTAGVDGKTLFINILFFISLSPEERVFLLAHECLHIAFRHIDSFATVNMKEFSPAIEHDLYNRAGDNVINWALVKGGYTFIPTGLKEDRFEETSTLHNYKVLHDEYKANPAAYVPRDIDIIFPSADGTAAAERELVSLRGTITDIIGKAAIIAKMRGENPGSIPGDIIRSLDNALNPLLPFEVILSNYMSAAYAHDDYTFTRPNRRFMPDVLMPGVYGEQLCNIVTAFDVSGSVSDEELSSFGNGVRMIMEQLHPEKMTLIEFDTEIQGTREIDQHTDVFDIDFSGGGGTYIPPLFDWINEHKPVATLIFTDGYFHIPEDPPAGDVIWIIHGNPGFEIPYGKVFHYQLKPEEA